MTARRTPPASVSPLGRRYLAREAVALYASPLARCPLDPAAMTREDRLIARAKKALARRLAVPGAVIDSPDAVRDFLMFELGEEAREVFCALFLDAQNRVLSFEPLFAGTLTQTSVYPREVVTRALHHQAAAVILAHNHPSGNTTPSHADQSLTQTLKGALQLLDVRVLDHIIVTANGCRSMAEMGLV